MTQKMKLLFRTVIILIIAASCQGPQNEFFLNANMDNVKDGMIVLNKVVDNDFLAIDSTMASNGQFSFSGIIEEPEVFYLDFRNNQKYHRVFLEAGTIEISGDIEMPSYSGSATQAVIDGFNEEILVFDDRVRALAAKYRDAMETKDEEKIKEMEDEFQAIEDDKKGFILQFVGDHNSSAASPYIITSNVYMFDLDELTEALASLDASILQSKYAVSLNKHIGKLEKVAVGKTAPLFTQNDTLGNAIALESLRGNYLLIDFWASWCSPCRAENPNLVEAYKKYHPKGFEILGVSLDRSRESWIEAIAVDKLSWLQVSDLKYWNNEVSNLYAINSVPANFLLDPEGKIIAKNLRGEELQEKLAEIFDE